jgi:AcrR family transcriptional regulator
MGKRQPYDSPRRREQAARTRTEVIDTARRLFIERGYAATSIQEVALTAHVGEQTVYRLFDTKVGLLREVLLAAVSGTSDQATLNDSADVFVQVRDAASPAERLRIIGQWSGSAYERGAADLEMVVFGAAEADPRVQELADTIRELRYQDVRRLVAAVAGNEVSPPPGVTLDEIADYIYATWSSAVYLQLVRDRGWTTHQYIDWSVRMVERMFFEQLRSD